MRADYTLARLYVTNALSGGVHIDLPKPQAHYLSTVLRKSEGDAVRLFNGADGEWRAVMTRVSKKGVTLEVGEQLRAPAPMPDIWLLFAPVKKARTEFIIEKATELGVAEIRPVITARTQFAKMRIDRARAQIIEAAEQTERLDIPQIFEPQKLLSVLSEWDPTRMLIFADEAGGGADALGAAKASGGPAAILIGPEGGFDDKERDILKSQTFVRPVSLGPRILRADTAAVAMLTIWQAMVGDWT